MSEEIKRKRNRKQINKRKGRERFIFLNVRISPQENEDLNKRINKANITKSEYVRRAISNTEIKEKPTIEFYEDMKQLIRIGNNVNQLAKKANTLNFIDVDEYKNQAIEWKKFMDMIKKKYL